jgi:TPP-dependent pyruvate/acetoin dehydrogenase alpha subunit
VAWRARDPSERCERKLAAQGVDVAALRAEIADEIEAACGAALAMPMPDAATAADGVFCDGDAEPLGDGRAPWSGFARGRADQWR